MIKAQEIAVDVLRGKGEAAKNEPTTVDFVRLMMSECRMEPD